MENFRQYNNEQGITRMEFEVPVICYCTLGLNYYKPTLKIEIELNDKIVDFLDLERYFKTDLNGEKLTCENLVKNVFDTMKKIYNPTKLKVCCQSDSHFLIRTIKEWEA